MLSRRDAHGTRRRRVLSGVDLTGKIFVITGATSGLGLMAARGVASAGATVVLAGRDPQRLRSAAEDIKSETPTAAVETVELELDSLATVRSSAAEISAKFSAHRCAHQQTRE
jgi:NAD(P)-dependent dehydrogenase (short-subunit alcohol dehydrogenase family)